MNNSLFNFRDDEEREMFFVAIPVIALFGILGYWLMQGEAPEVVAPTAVVAATDTDADGVADSVDLCVNKVGTVANSGCPAKVPYADKDNDGDGIKNGIDSCPETKGVAENRGCAKLAPVVAAAPVVDVDTDGDGITDKNDACVDTQGFDGKGCPVDTDADGVIDADDNCPEQAGSLASNGCPVAEDTDNDGVLGDDDQCPDQMGTLSSNGCPIDTDGDGIDDMSDACPSRAAETTNGCPTDTDADGVADDADQCPTEAGLEANQGCPSDSDGDGISDANDRCPQEAGVAEASGCPAIESADNDADGIPDSEDNCPSIKGNAENFGCPDDTDGDGIADFDDRCPNEAGEIEALGCPASAAPSQGQVQQVIDAAIQGVKFNSSSAVLTARSRDLLRDIAEVMKQSPGAVLEIRGHTDSSGRSANNMQLSMDRARACATFIAAQGVSSDNLKAYGYGDSQPIADNSTGMGRERNRRVEFELKF